MKKIFITLVLVIMSGYSFASLTVLVKPGADIYSDSLGFNGTAGVRLYFKTLLPFMPDGLYIGGHGFAGYTVWNAYSILERGYAGDIGYTFTMDKARLTPHILAGYDYLTLATGESNFVDKQGFYGEAAVEYEVLVTETVGIGLEIGYRMFMADTIKMNPFARLCFTQDLF